MKQPQTESTEEGELDRLEASALRPSVSPLQNLLATELATATLSADPLQKIRHVCEAFLMADLGDAAGVSRAEVLRIHGLSLAFVNKVALRDGELMVPWPFSINEAGDYLGPFCGGETWAIPLAGVDVERLASGEEGALAQYFEALYAATGTRPCHPGLVFELQLRFVAWALPLIVKLMTALFEKYVSGDTWEKTIAGLSGRKRTTHAGAGAEGFSD